MRRESSEPWWVGGSEALGWGPSKKPSQGFSWKGGCHPKRTGLQTERQAPLSSGERAAGGAQDKAAVTPHTWPGFLALAATLQPFLLFPFSSNCPSPPGPTHILS